MTSPLPALVAPLPQIIRAGDVAELDRFMRQCERVEGGLSPDELTAGVEAIAPVLGMKAPGPFSLLALVAGSWVEYGGSAVPLTDVAPACMEQFLLRRTAFSLLWPRVRPRTPWNRALADLHLEPPPGPQEPGPDLDELRARFERPETGLNPMEAYGVAASWFDTRHWVNLMITCCMDREFRDAAGDLSRLHAQALAPEVAAVPRIHFLAGLTCVLDDEPLVVLDVRTRRGFLLRMSGVGDNVQLHTLVADAVTGDPDRGLLAGPPVPRVWVDAATTGPSRGGGVNPVQRLHRMFDGTGAYVSPDGCPADLGTVDGTRVVVLHPRRSGVMAWVGGRVYEQMVPEVRLERVLEPQEVAQWFDRVTSAREDDLFAGNPDEPDEPA